MVRGFTTWLKKSGPSCVLRRWEPDIEDVRAEILRKMAAMEETRSFETPLRDGGCAVSSAAPQDERG